MTIRTHNCGELNNNHIDKTVQLSGWVNSIRTHGQIIFIDIRDRFGKTQAILNSDELVEIGKTLSNEDVINQEMLSSQGKPEDINGYYFPNDDLAAKSMRPSKTLNGILSLIN